MAIPEIFGVHEYTFSGAWLPPQLPLSALPPLVDAVTVPPCGGIGVIWLHPGPGGNVVLVVLVVVVVGGGIVVLGTGPWTTSTVSWSALRLTVVTEIPVSGSVNVWPGRSTAFTLSDVGASASSRSGFPIP